MEDFTSVPLLATYTPSPAPFRKVTPATAAPCADTPHCVSLHVFHSVPPGREKQSVSRNWLVSTEGVAPSPSTLEPSDAICYNTRRKWRDAEGMLPKRGMNRFQLFSKERRHACPVYVPKKAGRGFHESFPRRAFLPLKGGVLSALLSLASYRSDRGHTNMSDSGEPCFRPHLIATQSNSTISDKRVRLSAKFGAPGRTCTDNLPVMSRPL